MLEGFPPQFVVQGRHCVTMFGFHRERVGAEGSGGCTVPPYLTNSPFSLESVIRDYVAGRDLRNSERFRILIMDVFAVLF